MVEQALPLRDVRVLAAINGTELFGHERGNLEVFKALRNQGAQVRVGVNAAPNNQVAAELDRLGIAHFPLPFGAQWSIRWVLRHPTYPLRNLAAVLRCSRIFLREVRAFHPTHIHLGSSLVYSFISLALVARHVPMIFRVGDAPPVESNFNLMIWRHAMRRSNRLVAISDFIARSVNAAFRNKVGLPSVCRIYNLAPAHEADDVCANPVAMPSRINIVYVGAVAEHKGLNHLIEAWIQLCSLFPGAHLHVVGGSRYDRDYREALHQIIRKNGLTSSITLHGFQRSPSHFLRQATLHVAPSICDEAAGNVVVEAKREGIPSVVYPSGGLPELVNHQKDGFVCADRNVASLVEGVVWMLSDPDRLRAMGRAARLDLEARFGQARFEHEWAEVYRQTLEAAP